MIIFTEADRRRILISAARREFITGEHTQNISEAFRMFAKAHPDECAGIPARISTRERDQPRTILDEYERPKCRKCGAPLFWKSGCLACRGKVKKNQWICKECGFKRITKDTLQESITKLKLRKEL